MSFLPINTSIHVCVRWLMDEMIRSLLGCELTNVTQKSGASWSVILKHTSCSICCLIFAWLSLCWLALITWASMLDNTLSQLLHLERRSLLLLLLLGHFSPLNLFQRLWVHWPFTEYIDDFFNILWFDISAYGIVHF